MKYAAWMVIDVIVFAFVGCSKWRNIHLTNETDQVVHIDILGKGERTTPESPWLSVDLSPGGRLDYMIEHAEEHGATKFKWTSADGRTDESDFIIHGLSMVTFTYFVSESDGRLVLRDVHNRVVWPAEVADDMYRGEATP